MKIIAVHLLNNYSGSPKVLMQLLKAWNKHNIETHLYTCGGDGFLSNIEQVNQHFYWYRFAENRIIRLLFLVMSQFLLAVQLLFFLKKTDILYINTVFPFGAAIVGKIIGCKIIYHIHETSIKPAIFKKFLFAIVKWSSSEVVYVSNFLAEKEPIKVKKHILYNVLENHFRKKAALNWSTVKETKIILMICSLKAHKGVNQFVKIAQINSNFTFKLVVNASPKDITNYFKDEMLPSNLIIYPTQIDTHQFYQEASILLNLSDTKLWVETFGLTILEAMAYGIPTIIPPVGGITELVENNENGYLIDSHDFLQISNKINELFDDTLLYQQMSHSACVKSISFNEAYFEKESLKIISN
jgi:glycosyltransferase involved in cell wall biosynthesis